MFETGRGSRILTQIASWHVLEICFLYDCDKNSIFVSFSFCITNRAYITYNVCICCCCFLCVDFVCGFLCLFVCFFFYFHAFRYGLLAVPLIIYLIKNIVK